MEEQRKAVEGQGKAVEGQLKAVKRQRKVKERQSNSGQQLRTSGGLRGPIGCSRLVCELKTAAQCELSWRAHSPR